jgi:hypothetical protein
MTNISPNDTIRIVRMCIKMSDAIIDCDTLHYLYKENKNKEYKFKLKSAIQDWASHIENFSSTFLIPFTEADESTCVDLSSHFRNISEQIVFLNEEITALVLVYSKCVSILLDIIEMRYTDAEIEKTKELSKNVVYWFEKQCKHLLSMKDSKGFGVRQIVIGMNELGKKIMYND